MTYKTEYKNFVVEHLKDNTGYKIGAFHYETWEELAQDITAHCFKMYKYHDKLASKASKGGNHDQSAKHNDKAMFWLQLYSSKG